MIRHLLRQLLVALLLAFAAETAWAQTDKWRDIHKVKKKETIYSIARDYEITVEELMEANPEMKNVDYKLKKGTYVFIPYSSKKQSQPVAQPAEKATPAAAKQHDTDVRKRAIRLGIMLPLHDINGDGRRMVEYYRGILMACDSLKKHGISTDVYAWNVPENADITKTLADANAARCDIIFGPLYSTQVAALSNFAEKNDILMVIPFSIRAPELLTNKHLFQVYQGQTDQNDAAISHFMDRFKAYRPVIVDCADSTSTKGAFTALLRRTLDNKGVDYSLTSLASSDANFLRAFSTTQPNVVILNTARLTDLNQAFGKLSGVSVENPELRISMMGYADWLAGTHRNLENYYKYDVYIPSPFYLNSLSPQTERMIQKYRANFKGDMIQSLPRFAITGFDHAFFFLHGLHKYGKGFTGAPGMLGFQPVQTPLKFEHVSGGGYQNRTFMFVHYTPEHRIEIIND